MRVQQDAAERAARLKRAQDDYQAEDEHAGGQQGNLMLELQRAEASKRKAALSRGTTLKDRDKRDNAEAIVVRRADEVGSTEAAAVRSESACSGQLPSLHLAVVTVYS